MRFLNCFYRFFGLLVTVLFAVNVSTAQVSFNSEEELIAQANKLFSENNYTDAKPLFSQLLSLHADVAEYNYKFGACMLFTDADKAESLVYLEAAARIPNVANEAFYYLGKAYHLNFRFDDAIAQYNKYKSGLGGATDPFDINREIAMCQNGKRLYDPDYIFFPIAKSKALENEFYRKYDLRAIKGKMIPKTDNFMTKYEKKINDNSLMFVSQLSREIYFTGYGEDGANGMDIYRVFKLPNGEWAIPQRLPDVINTKYDEAYAFMHPEGDVLYFSSKGHNTMGGFDIFMSTLDRETDTWSKPVNLKYPFNTPDDDLFYALEYEKEFAHFATKNFTEPGKMTVYKVSRKDPKDDLMVVKGQFSIAGEDTLFTKVQITIQDKASGELKGIYNSNRVTGNYLLALPKGNSYVFGVEPEGFVSHRFEVKIPSTADTTPILQNILFHKNDAGEKVVLTNKFDDFGNTAEITLTSSLTEDQLAVEAGKQGKKVMSMQQFETYKGEKKAEAKDFLENLAIAKAASENTEATAQVTEGKERNGSEVEKAKQEEELKKEQEAKAAEEKAKQEELAKAEAAKKAEQEKLELEAKAKEEALKKEQEAKAAEEKAKQEELAKAEAAKKAEQEKLELEAKAKEEALKKEQEAKAAEEKAKQEELAKAEAAKKAEQEKLELEAKAKEEELKKEQETKAAEEKAKQEELAKAEAAKKAEQEKLELEAKAKEEELKKEQEAKAAEEKAKQEELAKAEKAKSEEAKRELYNKLVNDGDKAAKEQGPELARQFYEQASKLYPEEKAAKEKIEQMDVQIAQAKELEKEQKAEMAAVEAKQKAEKESRATYEAFIEQGDNAMKAGKYELARQSYQEAEKILPNNFQALHKIQELDELVAAKEAEKKETAQNSETKTTEAKTSETEYLEEKNKAEQEALAKHSEEAAKKQAELEAKQKAEKEKIAAVQEKQAELEKIKAEEEKALAEHKAKQKQVEQNGKTNLRSSIDSLNATLGANSKEQETVEKTPEQIAIEKKQMEEHMKAVAEEERKQQELIAKQEAEHMAAVKKAEQEALEKKQREEEQIATEQAEKAKQEELAKVEAAKKAEQEKIEQETKAAEEKAKQEELAQAEATKKAEQEKAKEEKLKKEQEAKAAEEKAAAEEKRKAEEAKLAAEKAKKKEEATLASNSNSTPANNVTSDPYSIVEQEPLNLVELERELLKVNEELAAEIKKEEEKKNAALLARINAEARGRNILQQNMTQADAKKDTRALDVWQNKPETAASRSLLPDPFDKTILRKRDGVYYRLEVVLSTAALSEEANANIPPEQLGVISEELVAYTTGYLETQADVILAKGDMKDRGISNYRVIAYHNGEEIPMEQIAEYPVIE